MPKVIQLGRGRARSQAPASESMVPLDHHVFASSLGPSPFPYSLVGDNYSSKNSSNHGKNRNDAKRNEGEVRSAANLVPTIFPKPRDPCTDSAPTSSSSPTDALWRDEFRSRVPYRSLLRCPKLSNVGPWPISSQTQLETPAGKNEEQQLALDLRTRGLGGPRARG